MKPLGRHYLSLTAALLQCLDEQRAPIKDATASGFIRQEGDDLFLYTCWHVLTGLDPSNVRTDGKPPARRYVRVLMQAADRSHPAVVVIGKSQQFDIPLYDETAAPAIPLWYQDQVNARYIDVAGIRIAVPEFCDVAKLKLTTSLSVSDLQILREDQSLRLQMPLITPGDKTYIVGYPYGYSLLGNEQPTPIVLTRFIAAAQVWIRKAPILLESIGAKGMSGAPVFVERDDGIFLFGIYTGVLFPDFHQHSPDKSTALGRVCNLSPVFWDAWPLERAKS